MAQIKGVVVNLLKSSVMITGLVLLAAYWVLALVVPARILYEFTNSISFGVALAVFIAYLPVAYTALTMRSIDRIHQLTLGICVSWAAFAAARMYSLLWRANDSPSTWADSPVLGFLVWISILGGALHITAPGAIDGKIPNRNWVMLGVAFGAGCMVAGVIIGLRMAALMGVVVD